MGGSTVVIHLLLMDKTFESNLLEPQYCLSYLDLGMIDTMYIYKIMTSPHEYLKVCIFLSQLI